jgi:hypothetical protein
MVAVVASLLHFTVPVAQLVVKVTLSVPHTVPEPVTTGAVGAAPVVIVTAFDTPDVPHELVHVAVKLPAPTSLLIPEPKPDDHEIVPSAQPDAVKVAFSVPQTCGLLLAIVGADGADPVFMVTAFETGELPQSLIQVAV